MLWSDVVPRLRGLAHLATVRPDGRPHVSVVSPAVEDETVWIATFRSSRKARNLAAGSAAALVWSHDAEVYVDAVVDLVDDAATKQRLWNSGEFPYDPGTFFGSVDNPDFVLLRLRPTAATIMTMADGAPQRQTWRADSV